MEKTYFVDLLEPIEFLASFLVEEESELFSDDLEESEESEDFEEEEDPESLETSFFSLPVLVL
jgi:hypothetical protein